MALDKWNVWYHHREQDRALMANAPWQIAPPLTEDIYTLEDALVAGSMLITLLNHADRVKIACLAQLVNVIAPIFTVTGGPAWRQTIFYPFLHASRFGQGAALKVQIDSPHYATAAFDRVPLLDAAATIDEERGTLTLFAVNRSLDGPLGLAADLRAIAAYQVVEHLVLEHEDPLATNSAEQPERVTPHAGGDAVLDNGRLTANLPRLSWNVIRLADRPSLP